MSRLSRDILPCKWLNKWTENQSPLGSGLYWPEEFEECGYNGSLECNCEEPDKCNPSCPAYEPVPTKICPKHDVEYLASEWCGSCEEESYREIEKAAGGWRKA